MTSTSVLFIAAHCLLGQSLYFVFLSLSSYTFSSTQAITGLNGMQLGEKKLIVQRASVGAKTNMNNVSAGCNIKLFEGGRGILLRVK